MHPYEQDIDFDEYDDETVEFTDDGDDNNQIVDETVSKVKNCQAKKLVQKLRLSWQYYKTNL
jgi:hypothetical protein